MIRAAALQSESCEGSNLSSRFRSTGFWRGLLASRVDTISPIYLKRISQLPARLRETDIRTTRAPTAPIDHASDTNTLMTDAAEPLGDTKFVINLKKKATAAAPNRSEEHTSELQSLAYLVCRLLLEKKKKKKINRYDICKKKK